MQPGQPDMQAIQQANAIGGRNAVGIASHLVENRFVGIKSRGVYEAPGMELLGTAYAYLLQLVLDRRSREVVITPAGTELDAAVRAAFDFPAERINRLPASARDTLSELLAALSTDTQGREPLPSAADADR